MPRSLRRALALLALTFSLGASTSQPAFGQTATDSATAETLFNEALLLLESRQPAEACLKLEASQSLDPGVGTLLYLADCYRQLGRTASAWATFRDAAYLAKDQADEREAIAIEHASELEPQLSYLTVTVTSESQSGLQLEHDGKSLSEALWGSAFPVDPGAHTISASAPGKQAWSQTVDVPTGPIRQQVVVPELAALEPEPIAVTPAPADTPAEAGDTRRIVGWGLLGLGGGAVITSGVLALLARGDDSSAAAECRPDRAQLCSAAGVELGQSAATKATLAGISGGLGLAALGAGLTLLLLAPADRDEPAPELAVSVTGQRGFISLTSTW